MFTHLLSTIWFLVICFVGGLAILVKGADWLVDGASDLAKRLGVSDLMIGLTVVAFGTSMPEFIVNMTSVSTHSTDLAITNVLGSNIINTLVILGCSALVFPIVAKKETVRIELPLTIIAGIMTLLFVWANLPRNLAPSCWAFCWSTGPAFMPPMAMAMRHRVRKSFSL